MAFGMSKSRGILSPNFLPLKILWARLVLRSLLPILQTDSSAAAKCAQRSLEHTTQGTRGNPLLGRLGKRRRHKGSPKIEHYLVVQLLANDILPALQQGEGNEGVPWQPGMELTSGNTLLQDSDDWMRMPEAVHWSLAGCVHPMRSNREMTSTMREARRTMIALQKGAGSSGCGIGVPSTGPLPEEGYLDGSALCLVPLVAGNEVVDQGENDVEYEDDSRGQQGPQVKGHTRLQRGRT